MLVEVTKKLEFDLSLNTNHNPPKHTLCQTLIQWLIGKLNFSQGGEIS